ncbi:MAG TPA: hypothetical protein VFV01_06295, partial [Spirillospora sp.]|nr:hypothetical protein [Spirillospora sp.]
PCVTAARTRDRPRGGVRGSTSHWLTLLLAFMLSVFLADATVVLGAGPGMLIAALTGHTFG